MRLLLLGHCSYYTVANLSEAIREFIPGINVTAADPVKPGGGLLSEEEGKAFDEVISLPVKRHIKISAGNRIHSLVEIFKNKANRSSLLKNLFLFRFKPVFNQINSNAEEIIYSDKIKSLFSNYDIFHFHYLSPEYLYNVRYIHPGKKVIMTFWGSDLYQISGTENYRKQLEAFVRADIITVNALEIKETVLAKFGRNLEDKIRFADFGLDKAKLNRLNSENRDKYISGFRKKNNIDDNKVVITIGYSGSSKQKHIEILKILDTLDEKYKKRIFALIPLTYGLQFEEKDYPERVKKVCDEAEFETLILENYMTDDALAGFTFSSDITLNLRDTDALNASMLESIYAGNILVNGAWLPYGKLKRLGIYFREIDKLSGLKELIPFLLDNFEKEKIKTSVNTEIIKENFLYDNFIKDWEAVYKNGSTNMNQSKY